MLSLDHRSSESLVRYWAGRAVNLAKAMEDASLDDSIQRVEKAINRLDHDRRVLVLGERGSGKSSVLAGLSGLSFLPQHSMQQPYVRWRYSCRDSDGICSRFVAEPKMLGIELVDTQPLSNPDVQELLPSLIERTDILICVLDARSKANDSLWQLVEDLPEAWMGHCVLVVTHTDSLAVQESLDLKLSLRERCHAIPERSIATYFVPMTDAKTVGVFASRIAELLNSPEGHRADIKALAQCCDSLLYAEHAVLTARESLQRVNAGFVDGIDREIDHFQNKQCEGLDGAIDHYFGVAREAMPSFARVLLRGLNPCLTPSKLLRLECFAEAAELYYYRSLCAELLQRQADADRMFVLTCESHWKTARPCMVKALACDIGVFDAASLGSSLESLRRTFMVQLYDAFLEQKLRFQFFSLLQGRFSWLKGGFLGFCLFVVAAGIFGCLNWDEWAFGMLACAGVVWLFATLGILRTSYHIRQAMLAATDELVESMKLFLREPMSDYITRRVTAYRRMYVLPRQTLAKQSETLEPMQKAHSEIHRQLRALNHYL